MLRYLKAVLSRNVPNGVDYWSTKAGEYKHHTLGETLGGTGTRSSTLMERSIPDLSECHHPSGMFESLGSTLR